MPYRLEAEEMISAGMRRILLERVTQIIDDLTNPQTDRDIGVHEARKNCKRVRAAYRLIRGEIGEELYRGENFRFRDTARLLARARDSWVLIPTLDRLIAGHTDNLLPEAFTEIRQYLTEQYELIRAQELANEQTIPEIITTMQAARLQIENLPIRNEDFSALRPGIQRVYRQGRQAMQQAYAHPAPGIFHEWRKRVKYLWHQIELLEVLWPSVLSKLGDELHLLSDYLGDDHDLAVLRWTVLDNLSGFRNEQKLIGLVTRIDQERLALEAAAQPLGRRIYFDSPKLFAQRLETYWQAWQDETVLRLRRASPTITQAD